MAAKRSLGRQFGWLWAAYAVSAYGSALGFGALPLIAVLVLHASPAHVSALSAVGPAVGGAAIGLFGPVDTVVADALSYLLSALGITAIHGREQHPQHTDKHRVRAGRLFDGWRHLLSHSSLRALYLNQLLVGGLIMATEPLLAVLLLGELGFPPWQYGLAFAAPCVGGLIGSRLASRVVARHGQHRILRTVGTLRAIWLIGLAFLAAASGVRQSRAADAERHNS